MDITRSVDAADPPGRYATLADERAEWVDHSLFCLMLSAMTNTTRLPGHCIVCGKLFVARSVPKRYCGKRCQARSTSRPAIVDATG